ncbi:response regulator transcription factor [Streptomyces kronopolitis]|uniref:response regulator transcription factor n=1 Tax=Streptomyces kronopolitis TaxID=1612435 RepID=UPI00368FADE1
MRVLVVEDEEFLADMIVSGLRRAALTVDIAHSGRGALDRLRRDAYDVLVLDQDLPGLHGDEVFRYVVEQALPTRVLLLVASSQAAGPAPVPGGRPEPGADDLLTKPFAFDVLRDRVLALGRSARSGRPPVIERAGVRLDTGRRLAVRDGRPLALSRREFGVLEVLLRAQGAVVGDDELIEEVWEEQPRHRTNAVRVTLGTLRAKLGDPPVIEAVPAAGYRMGDGPAAGDAPSASGEPAAGALG